MADKASSSLSASILIDEIKASMSGSQIYEPADGNDKWVFSSSSVTGSASDTDLLGTSNSYLGGGGAVAAGDIYRWICIKNITTTTTEGIGFVLDAGDAVFNAPDLIVVAPGEMVILKPQNCTVAGLHARSCVLDANLRPTSQGTATVSAHVAAILDDQ
tara:strand:+ start:38 stop:514 length:477 start_codon:yes stop_codon:yes gene_type:complete